MTDTQYTPRIFGLQVILDSLRSAEEMDAEFAYAADIKTDSSGRQYIRAESYDDETGDVSHTHKVFIEIETTEVHD